MCGFDLMMVIPETRRAQHMKINVFSTDSCNTFVLFNVGCHWYIALHKIILI